MTTESNSQNQNKRAPTNDDKEHEIQVLQERIEELEEVIKKSMETNPTIGFQTATDMVDREIANQNNEMATNKKPGPGMEALMSATGIATITTTIPNEVTFPSTLLGKFFIASRNCKQHMKLKLNGTTVEAWEVS